LAEQGASESSNAMTAGKTTAVSAINSAVLEYRVLLVAKPEVWNYAPPTPNRARSMHQTAPGNLMVSAASGECALYVHMVIDQSETIAAPE
jgi:hypothetical protein